MKKLLLLLVIVCPLWIHAQPAPPVEATPTQVGAGTLGYPFVVTPRGLLGFGPVYTNLAASTVTQIVTTATDTSSNALLVTVFHATTNIVVITNGVPPTVGQMLVVTGTNAAGTFFVKGTNVPTGGTGTGTLLPPNAAGVLTNNGSGSTNWSTTPSISLAGVTAATLPYSAADSSWASVTNYPASTNAPVGTINQVPLATGGTNTFGSPTFNWGALPLTALSYQCASNTTTNWVIGYLTFTNADGRVCAIPVGTNQ